jgi:transposase-like protein
MPRKTPFKHHRFPREIILYAVRWYLRYHLSYQDVVDLLTERTENHLRRVCNATVPTKKGPPKGPGRFA